MYWMLAIAACLLGAPAMVQAQSASPAPTFLLSSPVDCDLGRDCYIQQYRDHDVGAGAMDYRCAGLSYDGHKGTDFAVATLSQMEAGVAVIAAAPGTVKAVRDGMEDAYFTPERAEALRGRECGNGLVIDHGQGWETQYCHLKEGSIRVTAGDVIARGDALGQIGMSGRAAFPHLHLSLRKDGAHIDPFDPDGKIECNAPDARTLWATPMPYQPGGVLDVGFADHVPSYEAVKIGRSAVENMQRDADALVLFGYAFGGRVGDQLNLVLLGPTGVVIERTEPLNKAQAQFFRAIGKRTPPGGWPAGHYQGVVTLLRDGAPVDQMRTTVTLR